MQKSTILLFAAILSVGIVLLSVWMMQPSPGVTKRNFDRILVGMTKNDVEEIFGTEPFLTLDAPSPEDAIWHNWKAADDAEARIRFIDDRVTRTIWTGEETIFDKIFFWRRLR